MDVLLEKVLKDYGALGVLFYIVVKEGLVWRNKWTGKFVSWQTMMERIKRVEASNKERGEYDKYLQEQIDAFVKKQEEEIINTKVLCSNQEHLKETITDIKDVLREMRSSQQKTFDMIGDIKTHLMQR